MTDSEWLELWDEVKNYAHLSSLKHKDREGFIESCQLKILEAIQQCKPEERKYYALCAIRFTHSSVSRRYFKDKKLKYVDLTTSYLINKETKDNTTIVDMREIIESLGEYEQDVAKQLMSGITVRELYANKQDKEDKNRLRKTLKHLRILFEGF